MVFAESLAPPTIQFARKLQLLNCFFFMFTLEVIGAGVHQLVLQHVSMGQTGEYRSPDFILSF